MWPWAQSVSGQAALFRSRVGAGPSPANRRRKLDDRGGGHLINLGCGPLPASHDLWILRVLVGKGVGLRLASSMSHEGVRKRLKKSSQSLAKERMVPSQGERGVVATMEDLLDLHAEPYDSRRSVVCFDETTTKIVGRCAAISAAPAPNAVATELRLPQGGCPKPVPDL